jgi:hypothetical protein
MDILECIMCGEILGHEGKFCSEECEKDYRYENRTCSTCGGEFWDGGTSCSCDSEDDEDNFQACAGCDGHDACRDFGCAIEQGIKIQKDPAEEW